MRRALLSAAAFLLGSGDALAADAIVEFVLPSKVQVRIVEAPFETSAQTYDPSKPCLVDGRIPFGVDCTKPNSYVKSISVQVAGRRVELEAGSMYNAWEGRPLSPKPLPGRKSNFRYFGGGCATEDYCVFRGLFSDAAGTFVAEWVVMNGVSARTILSNSSDIKGRITSNIDAR